jgi:hypothetical protein
VRTEVLVKHEEAGQRGDRRVERHQHAEHRLRERRSASNSSE